MDTELNHERTPPLRIGTGPCGIRRIALLSYVSPGAPPVSMSTRLATRIHGSQSYSPPLRCAIGTERFAPVRRSCMIVERVGGKTTRRFRMRSGNQLLPEFIYVGADYTTRG